MTSCHILLGLLSNEVLILGSLLMSWPRFIISFFGFLAILFGPPLILHTIPIERCAFLYALVIDVPMSFPHLFIRSLVEVHRSSSSAHALFFLDFIHRILLHLGLEDFPVSKPIYIIALIGATFLRQRAAQMRASSKRPKVELLMSLLIRLLLLLLHLLLRMIPAFVVCWTLLQPFRRLMVSFWWMFSRSFRLCM